MGGLSDTRRRTLGILAAVIVAVAPLAAQPGPTWTQPLPETTPTQERPDLFLDVAFEQKLDARVPADLVFRDETGRTVEFGEYFGRRPLVLVLMYYECPMLCSQVMSGLVSALDILQFNAGEEYDVVAVSFDSREGPELAAAKKASYVEQYGRPGADEGFHFLTGPETSILQLTEAAGFRYKWDPTIQQFAHATGIVVLTPDGRVSKYYYGIEYSPRDLRLGLVEASEGQIGSPVDQVFLYCYHYDPSTGKYGFVVMAALRIAGGLTLMGLLSFWATMWWRGRRSTLARAVAARHS